MASDTRSVYVPRSTISTVGYSDGESVVSNIYTSMTQIRNKRRRVDVASLREASDDGVINFEHSPTDLMVADGTTEREMRNSAKSSE